MQATNYNLKPKVKEFLEGVKGLYINGNYVPAISGKTFPSLILQTKRSLQM